MKRMTLKKMEEVWVTFEEWTTTMANRSVKTMESRIAFDERSLKNKKEQKLMSWIQPAMMTRHKHTPSTYVINSWHQRWLLGSWANS
jgi:hypothetical protein